MTLRSRPMNPLTIVLSAALLTAVMVTFGNSVAQAGIPEVPYAASENVTMHMQYSSAAPLDFLDVVQPTTSGQNRNGIVLIHGGGYNSGSKKEMDEAANSFVAAGWVAFNINYSLNGFPAETNDAYAAVAWVKQNAATYGVDPDHIAVLGSSSGGTLAGMLATEGPAHGAGVAAVATWSGPLDLALLVNDSKPNSYAYTHTVFYAGGCTPSACASTYTAASPVDHITSSTSLPDQVRGRGAGDDHDHRPRGDDGPQCHDHHAPCSASSEEFVGPRPLADSSRRGTGPDPSGRLHLFPSSWSGPEEVLA
jgi:acetyl esterase/lipase